MNSIMKFYQFTQISLVDSSCGPIAYTWRFFLTLSIVSQLLVFIPLSIYGQQLRVSRLASLLLEVGFASVILVAGREMSRNLWLSRKPITSALGFVLLIFAVFNRSRCHRDEVSRCSDVPFFFVQEKICLPLLSLLMRLLCICVHLVQTLSCYDLSLEIMSLMYGGWWVRF